MRMSGIYCPECEEELPAKCIEIVVMTPGSYYYPEECEAIMARECPECGHFQYDPV